MSWFMSLGPSISATKWESLLSTHPKFHSFVLLCESLFHWLRGTVSN